MKLYGRKDIPKTNVPDHIRQVNDGMYASFHSSQMGTIKYFV